MRHSKIITPWNTSRIPRELSNIETCPLISPPQFPTPLIQYPTIPIFTIIITAIVSLPFAIYRADTRKSLFIKEWFLSAGFVLVAFLLVSGLSVLPYEYTNNRLITSLVLFVLLVIAIHQDYEKIPKQTDEDSDALFFAVLGWLLLIALLSFSVYSSIVLYNPAYFTSSSLQPITTRYPTRLPSPTYRPVPTTTHRPTRTPTPWQPPTSSNPYNNCHSWEDITLDDLGDEYCVMGTVRRHWSDLNQWASFITFGNKPHHFYMVTYDPGYLDIVNYCVMAIGTIERIGSAPVMVIDYGDLFYCN